MVSISGIEHELICTLRIGVVNICQRIEIDRAVCENRNAQLHFQQIDELFKCNDRSPELAAQLLPACGDDTDAQTEHLLGVQGMLLHQLAAAGNDERNDLVRRRVLVDLLILVVDRLICEICKTDADVIFIDRSTQHILECRVNADHGLLSALLLRGILILRQRAVHVFQNVLGDHLVCDDRDGCSGQGKLCRDIDAGEHARLADCEQNLLSVSALEVKLADTFCFHKSISSSIFQRFGQPRIWYGLRGDLKRNAKMRLIAVLFLHLQL